MDNYTIILCRLCSKKIKRYSMAVYPGDAICCNECNKEASND